MPLLWYLLFWLVLLVVACVNGAARMGYEPALGELRAHQLSTLTGCMLFWAAVTWFARKVPLTSRSDAVVIAVAWVALTFLFEAFMIVALQKKPWSVVWGAYDIAAGKVWIIALAWVALLPFMVLRPGAPVTPP